MASIYILDYKIDSAQGGLTETISAIKDEDIKMSSKVIATEQEVLESPFFLLQHEVQEKQESIYLALKQVVSQVVSGLGTEKRKETALIIGTSLVDLYLTDAIKDTVYPYRKKEYSAQKHSIDTYAKRLSQEFGLNDFTMSINTACTSSANALLEGSNLINSGMFENVIVVGVEIISPMMSSGFASMKLLSQSRLRPFDVNRDGLVLGEGVAVILLGKEQSDWTLMGGFSNCDSVNITSVSQSGDEYIDVMNAAIRETGISTKDITAIKAHATGTYTNDLSEINAISKVFDDPIRFTALKPYVGHTLGACGVLELAVLMGAIDEGFIPKTLSCRDPILKEYVPISEHQKCEDGIFMCNYFGFGGNNTSLIIKKESR